MNWSTITSLCGPRTFAAFGSDLDAVTQRQRGTEDRAIEPAASYTLVRASQDLRGGETSVGLIGTAVNRANDQWTSGNLRSRALVGGFEFRHRFLNRRYQFQASATASRVTGSSAAVAATPRAISSSTSSKPALPPTVSWPVWMTSPRRATTCWAWP